MSDPTAPAATPVAAPARHTRLAVALDVVLLVGALLIVAGTTVPWLDGPPDLVVRDLALPLAAGAALVVLGLVAAKVPLRNALPWLLGGMLVVAEIVQTSDAETLLPVWSLLVVAAYAAVIRRLPWLLTRAAAVVWAGGALVVTGDLVDLGAEPYDQLIIGTAAYVVVARGLIMLWNAVHGIHVHAWAPTRGTLLYAAGALVYLLGLMTALNLVTSDDTRQLELGLLVLSLLGLGTAWQFTQVVTLQRTATGLLEAAIRTPWPSGQADRLLLDLVSEHLRTGNVGFSETPGGPETISEQILPGHYVVVRRAPGDFVFTDTERRLVAGAAAIARTSYLRDQREEELFTQATTDDLTGLWDYSYWRSSLAQLLANRPEGEKVGVVFIDLDYFKQFNEAYGHLRADEVLATLGRRFRQGSRHWRFGRFGGDEFVGYLREVADEADLDDQCRQIEQVISEPVLALDRQLVASGTVGRTLSADPTDALGDLISQADDDLRRRKRAREATDTPTDDQIVRGLLSHGDLEVAFQPIVELASRQLVGWEALLRGSIGEHGPQDPVTLVEAAERLGALDLVTRELAEIATDVVDRASAATGRRLHVSVNLEHHQLRDDNRLLHWLLERADTTRAQLVVELTERGGEPWTDTYDAVAQGLAAHGIELELDDFGSGTSRYSSLASRRWDRVKLDRGFLLYGGRGHLLLEHTVRMLHALQMPVVLEGIETPEHLALAERIGVDYGQGLLFGAPISADAVDAWCAAGGPPWSPPTR